MPSLASKEQAQSDVIKHHKLYGGGVVHERFHPKKHKLNYSIFHAYIDLDHLAELNSFSRYWSVEKFNLVSFHRADYMSGKACLKETVIDKIHSETGQAFSGKVYLLSNLRFFGYCYNPVAFYFCFNEQDQLEFILADINNTPWNERYCYVHDCQNSEPHNGKSTSHDSDTGSSRITSNKAQTKNKYSFHFDKQFHVSPFMPMNMFYEWHYTVRDQNITIHMELFNREKQEKGERKELQFYANLKLNQIAFTKKNALFMPLKYPFICFKVVYGIYWNALKLWLKRVPFHSYPDEKQN